MDYCRNVAVSGGLSSGYQPDMVLSSPYSQPGSLDDLICGHYTENDVGLEWLSMFVEDCLTSTGNCIPPVGVPKKIESKMSNVAAKPPKRPLQQEKSTTRRGLYSLQKFVVPGKARSKIKRGSRVSKSKTLFTGWSNHVNPHDPCSHMVNSDPPLLQQAYWLADSELILPRKDESKVEHISSSENGKNHEKVEAKEEKMSGFGDMSEEQQLQQQSQPRRCTHCLSQRTPQWRAGPLGPKTLCNACGVRYKSGRLLPEYRPAKSPTFVSYKHSNSHKKVMEMRMAITPNS